MTLDPLKTASYDYDLPDSLIASYPLQPKESAKLLVYEKKSRKINHALFGDIFEFLPSDLSVLLNNTKVIKARIFGLKSSGGNIELLLNSPLANNQFKVYIKGKVYENSELFFDNNLTAKVLKLNEDGTRVVTFCQNGNQLKIKDVFALLSVIGHTPLPPYIKREDTQEDEKEYQAIFAKNRGSVAAPTASLHFSKDSFEKLKKRYETEFITLHVGAGTFKGVESDILDKHTMHEERYFISQRAKKIIESDKKILCVGTTATRSVEYFVRTKKLRGSCNLFINPLNPPQRVNHLLTNFHLPKSTLIMLVAGFIGLEETLKIYNAAIEKKYRFFSYGDAMLII